MDLPKINTAQEKILSKVLGGSISIPSTREELAFLLEKFRVAYDYESYEKGLIYRSSQAFLKTLARLGGRDELGFAYISSVMQVVEKRRSFKDLSRSTKNRSVSADKYLVKNLIGKGFVGAHGAQIRITTDGMKELKRMEAADQSIFTNQQ